MCGIVGKFIFSGASVDRALIKRMADTIIHRGPDDEGIHVAQYIGLGQRRLSIIDLSHEATAPLSNSDQSLWIVFNGEIYNFQELRTDLIKKGHAFRTLSDTEVIVHLYEEYGEACLSLLRGMFAFAIWDQKKKILFAARDRLGKKPFFYTVAGRALIFGSEIKAIAADSSVRMQPNYAAIDSYLSYQYVPSPHSAFVGIHKLSAGHYLTCDTTGNVRVSRYWQPPIVEKYDASREEIERSLKDILRESVQLRMISDVPVGAFLSGGIDSGTVVALMAMESAKPLQTFTIGFCEEDMNELPYARQVAEKYGTEHHEFMVRPAALEVLPLLVKHYDEPFADASALPTYYVSKYTRQHVTVALSGDGGDESFAGYRHYRNMLWWSRFDAIPLPIRAKLTRLPEYMMSRVGTLNGFSSIAKGLRMLGSDFPGRYHQYMSVMKDQEKHYLYTPGFKALIRENGFRDDPWGMPWDKSMDDLDWMMRHDQQHYLPDCLMVKTDIASMANSLEVRSPFLDHKLVEFSAGIPNDMRLTREGGKMILKSLARDLLPPDIINKKKTGFGVPLNRWFRGELSELLRSTLLDEVSLRRGLFNPRQLQHMVNEQISGARDWSNRLWATLFLELWFREHFD